MPARLLNDTTTTIVATYGSEYRGIVQYYLLADDVCRLDRLRWVTETSMLKTLAAQAPLVGDEDGPQAQGHDRHTARATHRASKPASNEPAGSHWSPGSAAFRSTAEEGGPHRPPTSPGHRPADKELITRLLAGRCELCQQRTEVQVHHVRKLADLTRPGRPQPAWAQLMAKRRRKTLVVCRACHDTIHARQPTATPTE